uniref:DNA polymerase III alpha subunit finger domain-containing protein n=1 Tax=Candidatus Phytoplasma australasiaticum subsp. australasiaticum TaxID=2832407 RepID=A0A7S7G0W9_9MOLU|nr:hypothetical protein H7685_03150 ['Parthenium hysterophorus' phyllody phytoplasma]
MRFVKFAKSFLINKIVTLIEQTNQIKIDLSNIPLNDSNTYNILQKEIPIIFFN